MKKISIIIPCYNQAQYSPDAIESILNQNYDISGVQIIVINDGSTDNTEKVAKSYPVQLINQENLGLAAARNTGIKYSLGDMILPLDADDKLHPDFLVKTVPILTAQPKVSIVHVHRQHFGLLETIKYSQPVTIDRLKEKCPLNYC